jgi:RNA polymerase sigma-70 factor (ECF subfamily)
LEGRLLEEAELVERARMGDVSAYEQLVLRYQDLAFRTAYLITGSAADAEDAAQEGFVKAYLALGRFRAGAPFRPWLLQIVANDARNRRKAAGRRYNLTLRAIADVRRDDALPSPESELLASERQQTLLAAVHDLREEERLVVSCRYLLGLTEAETAETLGLPKGTVKSRLSRALARLRLRLDDTLGDGTPTSSGKQATHG